jgi:hypothetical protein
MNPRPREPETLYRDNYDPIGYNKDESLSQSMKPYSSKYAQSKFAK